MALYDYLGNVIAVGGSGGSPIEGKRVHFIGDSNLQYISAELKTYLEETYGCSVTNSAVAGATWETSGGVSATDSSGVGQVNQVIARADSSKLLPDYDCIVVMLGTNCTTEGELTDTSSNVSTMCGAMKYCMEKLCYYGRQIPIGVIIPIRTDSSYSAPVSLPSKFQKIEEIAKLYNVPTLNLYTAGRVIPNGMTPDGNSYYLTDAVHMGANGKLLFKQMVGEWITYGMHGGGAGDKGDKGDTGAPGTSATHSWNGTVLTITSASGTSSANLKGDKGDTGAEGPQGSKGDTGTKGDTGATGPSGKDGNGIKSIRIEEVS